MSYNACPSGIDSVVSMVSGGCVRNELPLVDFGVFCFITIDSVFHLSSEILDESLHRPSCGVSESTNSMTFNLIGELLEHVNLCEVSVSLLYALQNVNHPTGSLSAGSALTAALVLVKLRES